MSTCFSGGAVGADTEWGKLALKKGHNLKHYIFSSHRSKCSNTIVLADEMLLLADPFLRKANTSLQRKFPCSTTFINNLLRRNFYQIINTERVYAISTIENNKIKGGTAWACQMYLDMCLEEGKTPEMYLYDQVKLSWFKVKTKEFVSIEKPPSPFGLWTGIGSKKISMDAISEIQSL